MENRRFRLFNNWRLKLASLAIAAALWLMVNNYHDPLTTRQYTDIPLRVVHAETLAENGQTYMIDEEAETIPSVRLTAKRSVVDTLSSDNIIATADLNNISPDGKVPVTYSVNRYSDSVDEIRGSVSYVDVTIEDIQSATFMLETDTVGTVGDGYVLSTITLEQNQIRVTGPESIVQQITRAAVVLDLNGASGTISTNLDIRLYDEDGDEIPLSSHLTANIDRVLVRAEVLPTKAVRVTASIKGQPASGYRVGTDITIEPGTVTISGRRAVLDAVTELAIPEEMLNVSGLKTNLSRTVNVQEILPEGAALVDPEHEGTVRVTVEIVKAPSLEESAEKSEEE